MRSSVRTPPVVFVLRRGARAVAADLVVINHALWLSPALEDFPEFAGALLDEAHELEDAATSAWTEEVSRASLKTIIDEILAPGDREGLLPRIVRHSRPKAPFEKRRRGHFRPSARRARSSPSDEASPHSSRVSDSTPARSTGRRAGSGPRAGGNIPPAGRGSSALEAARRRNGRGRGWAPVPCHRDRSRAGRWRERGGGGAPQQPDPRRPPHIGFGLRSARSGLGYLVPRPDTAGRSEAREAGMGRMPSANPRRRPAGRAVRDIGGCRADLGDPYHARRRLRLHPRSPGTRYACRPGSAPHPAGGL